MLKIARILVILSAISLMVIGCQNEPNPVLSPNSNAIPQLGAAKISIPAGATLDSATFFISVSQTNGQVVNIYRVTNAWDETTVTWNNFAGSYAPQVWGSFTVDALGYVSADITDLVRAWMDGTYANYGLLLSQTDENYPRAIYRSRENSIDHPYLRVCYTLDDQTTCVQEFDIADAEISELYPNDANGTIVNLYTGWNTPTSLEKQSLVQFDLGVAPPLASLGDFVWHDVNMNGIQDQGEAGIPGVTVNLYSCADVLLASTTTNASGYYLFPNLNPGDYYVVFVAPGGYVFSPQDQGADDALDSDADIVNGKTICTTLEAGENDMTWDAGLYMPQFLGCTLTIGYWKNHAGFKSQPDMITQYLPIWLGTAAGPKSLAVTNRTIAVNVLVMKTYGTESNGITKLYAQLLGAKLNLASGASDAPIAPAIAAADAFLANHNYLDWSGLSPADQQMVLDWMEDLDDYNNGLTSVPHCE
jgi:SdrD B-like domain